MKKLIENHGTAPWSVLHPFSAVAAGVDAHLDIWEGMVHGFLGSVGGLAASNEALQLIGEFLIDQFAD